MKEKRIPAVSVVMPAYNAEKYLQEAIDSILNQTFTDFEFLIIYDDSKDATFAIIEENAKKDDRIKLIYNKYKGLAGALNTGIEAAQGELIARMDADDIAVASRFQKQVEALDNNPKLGLLGTRYVELDDEGNVKNELRVPIGKDNIMKHFLLYGSAFCHSSIMFRKSYGEKVGFYDEAMKYAQDYDFAAKLFVTLGFLVLQDRQNLGSRRPLSSRKECDISIDQGVYKLGAFCGIRRVKRDTDDIVLLSQGYLDFLL